MHKLYFGFCVFVVCSFSNVFAQTEKFVAFVENDLLVQLSQTMAAFDAFVMMPSKPAAQTLVAELIESQSHFRSAHELCVNIKEKAQTGSLEFDALNRLEKAIADVDFVPLLAAGRNIAASKCFKNKPSCGYQQHVGVYINYYNGPFQLQLQAFDSAYSRFIQFVAADLSYFTNQLVSYPSEKLPQKDVNSLVQAALDNDRDFAVSFLSQDIEGLISTIKVLAESGNSKAMMQLGLMYHLGKGTDQNDRLAYQWFEKSAQAGEVLAMVFTGFMLDNGFGTSKDHVKAAVWYQGAAKKGNADAMTRLGIQAANGLGQIQNVRAAFDWFQKAIKLQNADAALQMGLMNAMGMGQIRDYQKAFGYFSEAARLGSATAMLYLGDYYRLGRGVEQSQINSKKWLVKATEAGNLEAHYVVGELKLKGEVFDFDVASALDYLKYAAERNHGAAQLALGYLYYQGELIDEDFYESFKWFKRVVVHGDVNAIVIVGEMYQFGLGVEQNYTEARSFYMKAVDLHSQAQFRLGTLYFYGMGVNKDYVKAKEYFHRAADNYHTEAMIWLSMICFIDSDKKESTSAEQGFEWLKKAHDYGNSTATLMLGIYLLEFARSQEEMDQAKDYILLAAEMENELALDFMEFMDDDDFEFDEVEFRDFLPRPSVYELLPLAEAGDVDVMLDLARVYLNSYSDDFDVDEAIKWLKKAADANSAEAMYRLGMLYYFGATGKRDFSQAFPWFQKAANLNHSRACFMLGEMYYSGLGVKTSYPLALKWYKKAAQLGDTEAMLAVGFMYQVGDGMPKNCAEAKRWYKMAWDNNDMEGKKRLENITCR
jgi:uncharacterized protein